MRVTALIGNFRAGLIGLLPSVERVGIPWKRPDSYDDWDDMVTAIYNGLVVEPIRWGLPAIDSEAFRLVDYDMLLPSYAGVSVIEVLPPDPAGTLRVFHALGTSREPFDIVEWRSVSPEGIPQSETLRTSPVDGIELRLRLVGPGGAISLLDEINAPDEDA
jgi:hypothetical protein